MKILLLYYVGGVGGVKNKNLYYLVFEQPLSKEHKSCRKIYKEESKATVCVAFMYTTVLMKKHFYVPKYYLTFCIIVKWLESKVFWDT